MDNLQSEASRQRFDAYIEALVGVIGHADRIGPLHDYCIGLLLPGERKSVEPMAALTAPARTPAQHQSLLHFVANASWSDAAVLDQVRALVLPRIEALGAIEASIVDDTSFPKKGTHSVGVARQYCGQLGKQDNCQSVVSLSLANHHASLPIAHRLYLPQAWTKDAPRRRTAKVPSEIVYQTKAQIALEQLRAARAGGLPLGTVVSDPGFGYDSQFRAGVTDLDLAYVVGIQSDVLMWRGDANLPLQGPNGGKPSRPQRRAQQLSAKALALSQPAQTWQTITWREAGDGFTSRFARLRVRPATRAEPPAEEWLLIEWPQEAAEPTKYWLSTLSEAIRFEALVDQAKLRWRIERDYQDLKQEVGLGHYQGRGWRGLHHHVTLCIAAYGFLVGERALFPPPAWQGRGQRQTPGIPGGDRSTHTAAASAATYAKLHRHAAKQADLRADQSTAAMSLLRQTSREERAAEFVTQ